MSIQPSDRLPYQYQLRTNRADARSISSELFGGTLYPAARGKRGLLVHGLNTVFRLLEARETGFKELAKFELESKYFRINLSPGGRYFAGVTFVENETIRILDAQTGALVSQPDIRSFPSFFDPDGELNWANDAQTLWGFGNGRVKDSGDIPSTVVAWKVSNGEVLRHAQHPTRILALAVSADGSRLAEAGVDKKVRIRDTQSLAIINEFRAHDRDITAVAWHPELPVLATASSDGKARIWNLDSGRCLETIHGLVGTPVAVAFSPTGKRFTVSDEGFARVWELESATDSRIMRRPAKQ